MRPRAKGGGARSEKKCWFEAEQIWVGRGQQESNLELHLNKERSITRHPERPNKRRVYISKFANKIQKSSLNLVNA
jgi:hypothetical protein